ncbi:MAG TPA: hypothetical protein VFH03_18780 [Actinoplanes sp.]|nr:hypothetical protein [Actinoplanes sp.]
MAEPDDAGDRAQPIQFPMALPRINLMKSGCRTVRPSTLTLNNTTPVELFQPITMVGTYTIPPFKGAAC